MWELKQIKEEPDENDLSKCEPECEFGKNCERFGSANTYNNLIRAGNSEELSNCFDGCGPRKQTYICYIPKHLLKTRRF
jgi:hypothetical protein